jgi:hypothetical protein
MCDTTGWGSFEVTYEGCSVINIGAFFRVDRGDGRGRYTAAWWEWDCGNREAKEVLVGITEREESEAGKEKKERKRKAVEKERIKGPRNVDSQLQGENLDEVIIETQIEESQLGDDDDAEEMMIDA